jgi:starch synthase (maltosyl-transferring)
MRRFIRQSQPDIVQSFLFHANVLSALAYSPWKIPLVGGVRVVDPSRRRALMSRLAATRMQNIVCVSQSVADACVLREGLPPAKLVVIQNGVTVAACQSEDGALESSPTSVPFKPCSFAQKQLGLSAATPLLLFVGRIDYQKGADVLLEQADRLLDALPMHNLVIVGDGPLKVLAQSRASQCEHEQRIHFAGRRDDVIRWMQSSQLLLLPTRYEGMPNVVLEAMSCGLPIVSTRAEGIVELLGNSSSEQTVAVNDWNAWVDKAIRLATDKERRDRISKENFDRCLQQFNLTDKLLQYERLYQNVLAARAADLSQPTDRLSR